MKKKILIVAIVGTLFALLLTLNHFMGKSEAKKFNAKNDTSKLEFLLENDFKKTYKDFQGVYTIRSFEKKFIEQLFDEKPHFRKVYNFWNGSNQSDYFEINYYYSKMKNNYPQSVIYNVKGDSMIYQQYLVEPIKSQADFNYFVDHITQELAFKKGFKNYSSYSTFTQDSNGRTTAKDSIKGKIKEPERIKSIQSFETNTKFTL